MTSVRWLSGWLVLAGLAFGLHGQCFAQAAAPANPAVPKPADTARFRKIAQGVETTIRVENNGDEIFDQHDIVEILLGKNKDSLNWSPNFVPSTAMLKSIASKVSFRRDVWNLEITFKPMRMIWVEMPQEGGRSERKLIYYLLYHVRNLGQHLGPVAEHPPTPADPATGAGTVFDVNKEADLHKVAKKDMDCWFFPIFSLETFEQPSINGQPAPKKKAYMDRLLPVAVQAIQKHEDPNRVLLNSVEICQKKIQVSSAADDKSVWAVATWEDVDMRLDDFAVVVEGLTNAYRRKDEPGWKPGDPALTGRKFEHRNLELYFWRPGDELLQDVRTIYFGNPKMPVDYRWIWR